MRIIKIESFIQVYPSCNELPAHLQQLYALAVAATEKAYAPYSKFQVGSAVLLANGATILGANQENAAYPSGLCAERVAVFACGVQHKGVVIKAVAVTASSVIHDVSMPISPCGSCLQVMLETETAQNAPIEIMLFGRGSEIWVAPSVNTLLPLKFNLKKN